jgi:tetratricopeptide (TPR) repeat protein
LDSGFAGSYTSRGIAYSNKGNYDLAISDYTKAIELEPNESEGYILRGMEYRMKGDLDQALIDFDSAIRIDPKAEPAYMGRGNVLLHKREYDKAIINYNKVLQLNPNSKDAYQFRGLTYAEMGSYDFAINDYDAAIKIDPDFANAYSARGEAYSKKGEYSKAISDYKKKLSLRPNDIGSYYPLAWINLYLGDGSAAYDNAIHFLERNGLKGNSAPYSILAGYFGLRKSNKPADAKIFLTTWIRNVSSNSWPGQIMRYLQGDLTEDQLLALAVDKDKLTEAHAYIGEIQLLTGNNSAARTHFSWVKDNGNKTFSEYNLALAELNRLDPPTPVRN